MANAQAAPVPDDGRSGRQADGRAGGRRRSGGRRGGTLPPRSLSGADHPTETARK